MLKEFRELRCFLKNQPVLKLSMLILIIIAGGFIIFGIKEQLNWFLSVAVTVVLGVFYLLFCYLMERRDRKLIEQHNQKVKEFLETE